MKGFFRQNCWLGFYYFECKWITYPIWMSLIRKGIFHDLMVFVGSTPPPPNQHSSGEWRLIGNLTGRDNRRFLPRIGTINNMNQTISCLKCVSCATWTTWTRYTQCYFFLKHKHELYDVNPNKAIKNICKPWGMFENLKQKKKTRQPQKRRKPAQKQYTKLDMAKWEVTTTQQSVLLACLATSDMGIPGAPPPAAAPPATGAAPPPPPRVPMTESGAYLPMTSGGWILKSESLGLVDLP